VTFRVHAPEASSVLVAGDFSGWGRAPLELTELEGGWWELQIKLAPGRYQYVYLIDGVAVTPPESTRLIDDGFGGQNGYLEIGQ
jgi:1,4-alpha-glucan branching enzyme